MSKYSLLIEVDIPTDQDGCLYENPSEVRKYVRDAVDGWRGADYPEAGIQEVKFKVGRIVKNNS